MTRTRVGFSASTPPTRATEPRTAFRKKVYRGIEELQADLDGWVAEYNSRRPHQGRWCHGKIPMQTFLDAVPFATEKIMRH